MNYLRKNKPNVDANSEHCKVCGGACCRQMSGTARPEDFNEPLLDSLIEAFKSGKWSIDWLEAVHEYNEVTDEFDTIEPKVLYIRPRHLKVKWEGCIEDPSWGGVCIFLEETGCSLPADIRPAACRSLHWVTPTKCRAEQGKEANVESWKPFQDVITKALEIVEE